MEVTVKLFANLRDIVPGHKGEKSFKIALSEGDTIEELLKQIAIPEGMAHLVLVNGEHSKRERALRENDVISIFPPLAGG